MCPARLLKNMPQLIVSYLNYTTLAYNYITDWIFILTDYGFAYIKDFTAVAFTTGDKTKSHPDPQATQIKEALHIILSCFIQPDNCVWILLVAWKSD